MKKEKRNINKMFKIKSNFYIITLNSIRVN